MLKTLIDVKFPFFSFLFLWHFFALDMFFFYAEVRMFNRLGKTCVFFPTFSMELHYQTEMRVLEGYLLR